MHAYTQEHIVVPDLKIRSVGPLGVCIYIYIYRERERERYVYTYVIYIYIYIL